MDNKQTTIQKLMSAIEKDVKTKVRIPISFFYEMLKDALPKERQQIEEAFDEGNPNGFILKDGKEYFNQTYQ